MKKFSIIIPVYNTEKYLEECLNSVVNQSYKNIEIIVVNDGSTDNSRKIIDDFAKKDSRIITIHKRNEGVSIARNTGIDTATGEYVCFLDSDDYFHKDAVQKLFDASKDNPDMIYFNHYKINNNDYKVCGLKKQQYDINDFTGYLIGATWKYAWQNEFLQKNKIRYLSDIIWAEDTLFCLNAYCCYPKLSILNEPLIYYRIHSESICNCGLKYETKVENAFAILNNLKTSRWYKNSKKQFLADIGMCEIFRYTLGDLDFKNYVKLSGYIKYLNKKYSKNDLENVLSYNNVCKKITNCPPPPLFVHCLDCAKRIFNQEIRQVQNYNFAWN